MHSSTRETNSSDLKEGGAGDGHKILFITMQTFFFIPTTLIVGEKLEIKAPVNFR